MCHVKLLRPAPRHLRSTPCHFRSCSYLVSWGNCRRAGRRLAGHSSSSGRSGGCPSCPDRPAPYSELRPKAMRTDPSGPSAPVPASACQQERSVKEPLQLRYDVALGIIRDLIENGTAFVQHRTGLVQHQPHQVQVVGQQPVDLRRGGTRPTNSHSSKIHPREDTRSLTVTSRRFTRVKVCRIRRRASSGRAVRRDLW